jgi:hypothetical protein
LLDSNVFIAAIKDPSKQTHTLNLIMKIIEDPNVTLMANELLIDEMIRYAELLESETAATPERPEPLVSISVAQNTPFPCERALA